MPPRHPSPMTLFLAWFFAAPFLIVIVAALFSWLVAGIVAAVAYVGLFCLFFFWRERSGPDSAIASAHGLGVGGGPVDSGVGGFGGGGV